MTPTPRSMFGGHLAGAGLAIGMLVSVVLTGCGSSTRPAADQSSRPVQRVTIEVNDSMRFVPSRVDVHPGPVTIILRNVGLVAHNLDIPSLHAVSPTVYGGKKVTMTFQVYTPGTYAFICDFHVSEGKVGTLIVSRRADAGTNP
jgi:plastocyanin